MVNINTPRPGLTISDAVKAFDVSQATVKRGLRAGRYANAKKADDGMWCIPPESLQAEHPPRSATSGNASSNGGKGGATGGHDLERRVMELEQALAIERAERRAAERIAEVEAKRAELAERALYMIDAGPGRAAPAAPAEAEPPAQRAPESPHAEQAVEPLGRRLRRVFRPRG